MSDPFFEQPLEKQRQFVADCLGVGPGWTCQGDQWHWQRFFDLMLSIWQHDGIVSFWREVGRIKCQR
jgi:hypothetical protein